MKLYSQLAKKGTTHNRVRIGQPNKVKIEKDSAILSYEQYNDLYFADYYFKKDKLIKFRFGEDIRNALHITRYLQ